MATALEQPAFDPLPSGGPHETDATTSMTPPNSANGKKDALEGVPSELSDLELDSNNNAAAATDATGATAADDEIVPDHYYGGGKIPVFKPVSDGPHSTVAVTRQESTADTGRTMLSRLWTSSATSSPLFTRLTTTE